MAAILDCAEGLPEKTFEPGDVLIREGDRGGVMYILRDGQVEIRRGDTTLNRISEPGSTLGELSVLLDEPHSASVRALTRARCCVLQDPRAFFASHPELGLELCRQVARRLYTITLRLIEGRERGDLTDPDQLERLLEDLAY